MKAFSLFSHSPAEKPEEENSSLPSRRWPWQRSLQMRIMLAYSAAFLAVLIGLTVWLSRAVYHIAFDAVEHDLEVAAFLTANAIEDPLSGYTDEFIQYREWEREHIAQNDDSQRNTSAVMQHEEEDENEHEDEDENEESEKDENPSSISADATIAVAPSPSLAFSSPSNIDLPRLHRLATKYASDLEARVTILDEKGHPLVDSHYPASLIVSQINYPEVIVALQGDEKTEVRRDEFTGALMLVTAAPIQQGSKLLGFVQLRQPLQVVLEKTRSLVVMILLAGAVAILCSMALAFWIARQLVRPVLQLERAALTAAQGDLSQQVPVDTHDELGRLADAFNFMITALRAVLEKQRAFIANASHELRTPLTNIKLRIEAIHSLGDEQPEVSRRYLAEIEAEADRLTRLANTLLDLSRLEKNTPVETPTLVDLAPYLSRAAERMKLYAQKAGVALEAKIPPALPLVRVDAEQVEEAVLNLLDNAIKYTPAGGRVELSAVEEKGSRLTIQVTDTGIGIPPEDLPFIFDRFYRVDKARSRSKSAQNSIGSGAGLGLSIVKHLVEQNHGSITVTSEPPQGSTFAVVFPLMA